MKRLCGDLLVLSSFNYDVCFSQTKNLLPAYQAISTPDFVCRDGYGC